MSASIEEFRKKLRLNDEPINYKETGAQDVVDLYEAVVNEYKWSYEALLEMPIPAFMEMIGALKRRKEKEKKAYEDARRKSKKKGRN